MTSHMEIEAGAGLDAEALKASVAAVRAHSFEFEEALHQSVSTFAEITNPQVHGFLALVTINTSKDVSLWRMMGYIADVHLPTRFETERSQQYEIAWEAFWCLLPHILQLVRDITVPQEDEMACYEARENVNSIFVAALVAAMDLEEFRSPCATKCIDKLLTEKLLLWWAVFSDATVGDDESAAAAISDIFTTKFDAGKGDFVCTRAFDLLPSSILMKVLPAARTIHETCLLAEVCNRLVIAREDIVLNVELLKYFIGRMDEGFFATKVFMGDYVNLYWNAQKGPKRYASMLLILLEVCNNALQYGATGNTNYGLGTEESEQFFTGQARVVISAILEEAFSKKHLASTEKIIASEGEFYTPNIGWKGFTARQKLDICFSGEFLQEVPQ